MQSSSLERLARCLPTPSRAKSKSMPPKQSGYQARRNASNEAIRPLLYPRSCVSINGAHVQRGHAPALPPIFFQQRHSIIGKLGRNERFGGPLRQRPGNSHVAFWPSTSTVAMQRSRPYRGISGLVENTVDQSPLKPLPDFDLRPSDRVFRGGTPIDA